MDETKREHGYQTEWEVEGLRWEVDTRLGRVMIYSPELNEFVAGAPFEVFDQIGGSVANLKYLGGHLNSVQASGIANNAAVQFGPYLTLERMEALAHPEGTYRLIFRHKTGKVYTVETPGQYQDMTRDMAELSRQEWDRRHAFYSPVPGGDNAV